MPLSLLNGCAVPLPHEGERKGVSNERCLQFVYGLRADQGGNSSPAVARPKVEDLIQLKIRAFLEAHGLSVYELANAVVEETESLSEASVYKIASGKRNPSLVSLNLILTALSKLTHKHVEVADVLTFVPEDDTALVADKTLVADETGLAELEEDDLAMVWELVRSKLELAPMTLQEDASPVLVVPAPASKRTRRWKLNAIVGATGLVVALSVGMMMLVGSRQEFGEPNRSLEIVGLTPPALHAVETSSDNLTPTLRVEPVEAAAEYEFRLLNGDTGHELIDTSVAGPALAVPESYLCGGVSYTWTARVRTAAGWSGYASPASFMVPSPTSAKVSSAKVATVPPSRPNVLGPSGMVASLTPTLQLSRVPTTRHYSFYVRDLTSDALIYIHRVSTTPSHKLPEGLLKPNRLYRWNGRARNCAGFSEYSPKKEFRTE